MEKTLYLESECNINRKGESYNAAERNKKILIF